jgi:murein hydrolase activator
MILWLLPFAAIAEPADQPTPAETLETPTQTQQKALRERDLEAVRQEQRQAAETEAKLRAEIEAISEDRGKLNAALIETAGRVRVLESRMAASEGRIAGLDNNERTIRESLNDRRGVIAEVLAALQRIGRRPPPAVMVRPEDALQSVRTAMLLGAVLPEMRVEAEALVADLTELARVRKEIAAELEVASRDLAALSQDRQRMTLLVEERQKRQAETEQALQAERERAAELARHADSLKDLIAKLEQDSAAQARAAEAAARATAKEGGAGVRASLAALKDPGRLAPAVAFASAKGVLPLPVNGVKIREFGATDRLGGSEKGLSIATRAAAQVTAPCDGWVVYAGPFRSYGQLLILNAGGGYHVLLAGMERISVDLGQFVLTGEPVAIMGTGSPATLGAAGSAQPVLYVEFRKDGTPVDPGPWWVNASEKVRG